MAKKGQQQQENAKAKAAKRQKATEDKTFGLKNKNKSTKVQSFVKQVEAQNNNSAAAQRKEADQKRKAAEKKAAEEAKAEALKLLGSQIQPQKVPFGVDPKSVVCVYFKQGLCNKGTKCKFSHDLSIERKGAKKDLYSDERTEDKTKDTMDKWDDEKLRSVVMSKHGNPKTTTDKICKYFIEAVENGKYGWFWVCPNGGNDCKYRHSLPPGFKLKTKEEQRLEKAAAANEPKITLEDFIERERLRLPAQKTPVTFETFTKWKQERQARKQKEAEDEAKKSKAQLSGRQLMLSGKFTQDEDEDDGDTWDLAAMRRETQRLEQEQEEGEENQENPLGAERQAVAV